MNAPDPLRCTAADYVEHSRAIGANADDALQRYRRFYRHGDIDGLQPTPPVRAVVHCQRDGDTTKFTLDHGDDLLSESVIIPYRRRNKSPRHTLCVSSQIGCAMGCTFCQTAQLGLKKNLSARDIVEQWFIARHHFDQPIDNIVFMGMGEPMDNLDAVLESIDILIDHNGAAVAPSRMTISTVGRAAGIRRLAAFTDRPGYRGIKLAVSINAPSDDIRSTIMPINRAEPMRVLRDAMTEWRDRVLIEYVLIPDVNMQLEHADALAEYLRPINCSVNLIPYNPRQDSPWPAPDAEHVTRFARRLISRGLAVTTRRTTGCDIAGACGQLGAMSPRGRRGPAAPRDVLTVTTSPASQPR